MNPNGIVASRPAWREPLLWLVAGLPALVVAAGIATIVVGLRSGSFDAATGEVRRTAQVQVEDLAADRQARALGLRAELRLDPAAGLLQLRLASGPAAAAAPVLLLAHPTRAAADRVLDLQPAGDGWQAAWPQDGAAQSWNLRLAAADGSWRLVGRLPASAASAELHPALAL